MSDPSDPSDCRSVSLRAHFPESVARDLPDPFPAQAFLPPDLVERHSEAELRHQNPAAALVEAGEQPVEPLTVLGSLNERRGLAIFDEISRDRTWD